MSFETCLARLQAEGTIEADRAQRFRDLYAEMESRFRKQYGAGPGEVLAGEETLKALEWDAQLKRRQAALQIDAQTRGLADMERYDGGSGERDAAAIEAMIARDTSGRAPYASVEGRTEALDFEAQAMISRFLEHHRRDLLGRVRDKAGLLDVLRERHGQASGNAQAKAFSDAIGRVFETQRQRFNLLGGDIGYQADYGLTHRWSAVKVRAVDYADWRAAVLPELELERMRDPLTGQRFSEQGLEEALQAVYERIRTDGLDGLGESSVGGSRKLANRRQDARFLQFRDADAWLRVNERFGSADPFTMIMDQIHGMNRDLAMMERFGPNPDATVRWLTDQMKRRAAQSPDRSPTALTGPKAAARGIDKLWSEVNGSAHVPVLKYPGIVRFVHGARDLITAAKLGKAVLTALGDLGTNRAALEFNGLLHGAAAIPGLGRLADVFGYIREMKPSERALSADLELGMRDASSTLLGLTRYFGKTQGPETTKVIADASLRMTGLNLFTEGGQYHFGKTFLNELARDRGIGFDALRPGLRGAMERYGIDAAMWDAMRAAPLWEGRGRKFMSARLVRESAPQAAERLADMVLSETAAAVQMATARGRALTTFGNPGTFAGEVGSSLFQFKSFTSSIMLSQGMRIAGMGSLRLGATYAARLILAMTLYGAATLQLRQLSYGQDPRPMDGWEFWVDAMVTGGGIGIFGDIIGSFERQGAEGLPGIISGPLAGAAGDAGALMFGNIFRAMRGDQTHVLRDLEEFGRRNTPGSNTWYLSLAFQRLIFDQLRELADPNYRQAFHSNERRAREQGSDFWWRPGETAPVRAPSLDEITGG